MGGYTALNQFWEENELTPPILLPNIINAAIIHEKSSTWDELSDVARHAIQNSKHGAIKASKIAGDILNNKNDKSGHHDQFRIWWNEKIAQVLLFLILQTHIFNLIVRQLQY